MGLTDGKHKKYRNFVGQLEREDLGVVGRIILKCISRK
jgi:hypothetical protein